MINCPECDGKNVVVFDRDNLVDWRFCHDCGATWVQDYHGEVFETDDHCRPAPNGSYFSCDGGGWISKL